ncbi:MAG: UvrD-helicase domain-containing protein [Fimbriimonadales bacterium]|nr:UvrD-helicase domain-containing protein [Fimbriimonadales bacterium]
MRLQRTPTGEQLRIITQTQGEFVVLASAGSGKTHVVNERYLHLITEVGVRPSEILTITFTKKAAAEMKRRIVGSLRDKGLFAEAQEAETGPIQTVHSFYERILRENSVRAGLDPNFEVMSQRDVQLLRRQIIRRAATLDEQDEPYIAEFLREMLGSHDQDDPSAYASFVKVVEDTMKRFRESGIPRSEFESIFTSPRDYKERTDRFLFLQLPQVIQDAIRENLDQDWVKVAKDALKPTDKLCDWLKPKFDVEKFEHDYRMTVALAQIAIRCWLRFESELRKLNVLDFESMENRAVRLLEGDLEVRQKLKNLYPHIMVDEAQDNNPMQYRLLNG